MVTNKLQAGENCSWSSKINLNSRSKRKWKEASTKSKSGGQVSVGQRQTPT